MSSVKSNPKSPVIGYPLLAGIAFALIWLAVGALALSLLLHFTSMKESELGSYALIVHGVCSLAGGLAAGKRSEKKGWYNGGMLGLLYGIVVIIVSFLAANGGFSWDSLIMLGTALLTGSLGGMVGVNMRK